MRNWGYDLQFSNTRFHTQEIVKKPGSFKEDAKKIKQNELAMCGDYQTLAQRSIRIAIPHLQIS